MRMKTATFKIRFLSPAFLGDGQQNGTWRAPPFKAQLRQWWRLVQASEGRQWEEIRAREAQLFGHAWGDQAEAARKSRVRLQLSGWQVGKLSKSNWPRTGSIANGPGSVDAGLYLGYGPVSPGPSLKGNAAIQAGEAAKLRLAWPTGSEHGENGLQPALALMSRFGTVGGRSRNAWGSFVLEGNEIAKSDWSAYLINWRDGLQADWVRGIGCDERGPLVWRTRESSKRWEDVIKALAQIRAGVNRSMHKPDERCLLSYPVTKHILPAWGKDARLPNSLRFKVIEEQGALRGLVFHLPCRPPDELWKTLPSRDQVLLPNVWRSVHEQLDAPRTRMERLTP